MVIETLTPLSHCVPSDARSQVPLVAALGTLRVRGLATYGALDPPADPAPANVTVTQWAAHAAVLPRAAAVVCHGGHGTVMKALAHGAPLVVLPLGRDQKDNAARVDACGAGIRLSASASPARIASAVWRVLEDPRFREQSQRMAAAIARDLAEDRAVGELEALVQRQSTGAAAAIPQPA